MFCPKCGHEIADTAKFCKYCGADLMKLKQQAVQPKPVPSVAPPVSDGDKPSRKGNGNTKAGAIMAAAIVIIAGGMFAYKELGRGAAETPPAKSVAASSQQVVKKHDAPAPVDKQDERLEQSRTGLQNMGIQVKKVQATSFGHNENGYMVMADNTVYVVDLVNQRAARIDNQDALKTFSDAVRAHTTRALLVRFSIRNDNRAEDGNAGYWHDGFHTIPIMIKWKFDGNNPVDNGLNTGNGSNPTDFSKYLYEQRNVDMVHIFLTETMPLLRDMAERQKQ